MVFKILRHFGFLCSSTRHYIFDVVETKAYSAVNSCLLDKTYKLLAALVLFFYLLSNILRSLEMSAAKYGFKRFMSQKEVLKH